MLRDLFKNYVFPIAVFSGGMVGVGFLSLPFIATKVGIWWMLFYFVILTALVLAVNLIFCQISLKTPDYKRFPGYAKHHLGRWGEVISSFLAVGGAFGSLLIFLIVGGEFLSKIFLPLFGGNDFIYTLIYFVVGGAIIFTGIRAISKAEFIILAFLLLALIFVLFDGLSIFNIANIFQNVKINFSNIFLPFGPILFALWATGIIPEVEEMLVGKKKLLRKIIIISTISVSVFYFLFILLVLGLSGGQTTEMALTGLEGFLGKTVVSVALFAGMLATLAGFINQGIILKKVFVYDMGIRHWQAFVITCFTPFILLMLGFNSFISLISLFGGVLFGAFGIMILLMYRKIGGRKIIIYPLSLVFLLGVIYELIYFIK